MPCLTNQELSRRAVLWEIGMTKPHVSSDLQSLGHPGNFPVLLIDGQTYSVCLFCMGDRSISSIFHHYFPPYSLRQDLSLKLVLTDSTRRGLIGKHQGFSSGHLSPVLGL